MVTLTKCSSPYDLSGQADDARKAVFQMPLSQSASGCRSQKQHFESGTQTNGEIVEILKNGDDVISPTGFQQSAANATAEGEYDLFHCRHYCIGSKIKLYLAGDQKHCGISSSVALLPWPFHYIGGVWDLGSCLSEAKPL